MTVPGPLTMLQTTVNVPLVGNPSSLAVPDKVTVPGKVLVMVEPALIICFALIQPIR